jgi:hypothetical protein
MLSLCTVQEVVSSIVITCNSHSSCVVVVRTFLFPSLKHSPSTSYQWSCADYVPSHNLTITESTVERHQAEASNVPNASHTGNLEDLPIPSPKTHLDKRCARSAMRDDKSLAFNMRRFSA